MVRVSVDQATLQGAEKLNPEQMDVLAKLKKLGYQGFIQTYARQASDPQYASRSFEERISEMIVAQNDLRFNNRIQKKLKNANLRYPQADIERIEYIPDRNLDKARIEMLATEEYIRDHRHIIVMGAAGAGKTYLACALGSHACRNDIAARYVRMPVLMRELETSRLAGTYDETLEQFRKTPLLIIDEFLLDPVSSQSCHDLFEIVEDRVEQASMILCTQYSPEDWFERIGNPEDATIREAIIDRIVHNSYKVFIAGEVSMRERHGVQAQKEKRDK